MLPFAPVTSSSDLFREVRIAEIRRETEDAATFVLEAIGEPFRWQAGQFLTFVIATASGLVRRSYSFSSAPGERPAVTIKRISNGVFSRPMLETAAPGDRLTIAGEPSGFFVLPDAIGSYDQVLLFAAGSGITPVFPMIKHILQSGIQVPVVLAYSNSSPDRTLFRSELEALARRHPAQFSIAWFYSNNQDLLRARLSKTTLELFLSERWGAQPEKTLAFLCGPLDYMRMAAIVLQAKGIPAKNIRREVFTPDIPKQIDRPPDTKPHQVILKRKEKTYRLEVAYPDSILVAARKQGIELPYSCEAGRCGSCIAACTRGKVWMGYNEVLTDAEVAGGRVLVCQSFPVGGDVTIEYL
ncbi:MAG: ferredoxin--NADP reductase [Cyclobacteriaceae bacterium]|nr:ferredoxin--NADP reductase [Cyclobacteriaceae bacterium]